MGTTRRRQAGEGGISEYRTKAGPRFLIKYPVLQEDGTKRVVLKRGFTTRREAAAALRAEIRRTETGEWVHPSKQPLAAYLAEWLDGQQLTPRRWPATARTCDSTSRPTWVPSRWTG